MMLFKGLLNIYDNSKKFNFILFFNLILPFQLAIYIFIY